MARKFSTALRRALLGYNASLTASTISSAITGKKILDSANGLAIFIPGDKLSVSTALVASGYATVDTVQTDGSYITITETPLDQSAGASYTVGLINGRTLRDVFRNGILEVYSGTKPTDADATEGAGTKLIRVTVSSGEVVPGVGTNGLNFDAPAAGVLSKASAEVWSGLGLDDGDAAWFRFYTNLYQTGAGTTKIRFDGTVTASGGGGEIEMASVTIVNGAPNTIDAFTVTLGA